MKFYFKKVVESSVTILIGLILDKILWKNSNE